MTFKEDVTRRIKADFGEEAEKAMSMLDDAVQETEDLNTDRIIRCIVFLANGDLSNLHKYIQSAASDPRDIMLWAEYKNSNDHYTRIRDLDKTFEECEIKE